MGSPLLVIGEISSLCAQDRGSIRYLCGTRDRGGGRYVEGRGKARVSWAHLLLLPDACGFQRFERSLVGRRAVAGAVEVEEEIERVQMLNSSSDPFCLL